MLLHASANGVFQLLALRRGVVSLQLPFAILPLIRFTNTTGLIRSFTSPKWPRGLTYSAALLIISLKFWLVLQALRQTGALESAEAIRWVFAFLGLFNGALQWLITFSPPWLTPTHIASPQKAESVLHRVAVGSMQVAPDGTPSLLLLQ